MRVTRRSTSPAPPKLLAGAYLCMVVLIWLSHIAAVALRLATGRSSWTTENS